MIQYRHPLPMCLEGARSAGEVTTRPLHVQGSMKHGRNVPSAICRIGQKIVESSVTFVQVWDTRRIAAGRSPKMGSRILEWQTSWKFCWMMRRQRCNNLTGCVAMKRYFHTLGYHGDEFLSRWHQQVTYPLLKLHKKVRE
jgi:hypothetical protein